MRDTSRQPRLSRRATGATPAPSRGGFTLIEILVVLTIIVIISVSALPAMRFIMGSRSIEGAQNIIGSMISRARSQAIADGEQRGVMFFVDPVNDRTTMALVGLGGGDLDQYHGWTMVNPPAGPYVDKPANSVGAFTYYASGDPINTQSMTISLTPNNNGDAFGTYLSNGITRSIVRRYLCIQNNGPSTANRPTQATGAGPLGPTGPWSSGASNLQLVAGTDFQMLPPGVGVQLINSNPTGANNFDRYVRIGCIMFDKNGRFESVPWSIGKDSPVGQAIHLAKDLDLSNANSQPLYSQFGLVLYDRQSFLGQTSASGNPFTEGDFIFPASFFDPAIYSAAKFPAAFDPDEKAEETWLDGNSLPLLIDRYNGSVIKGE